MARALEAAMPQEWLPKSLLEQYGLMPMDQAIRLIHQPPADAEATGVMQQLMNHEGPAWNRIRFDELLAQQVALRQARRLRVSEHPNRSRSADMLISSRLSWVLL